MLLHMRPFMMGNECLQQEWEIFVIQHHLRSMQQHIIFKLLPMAKWLPLSSPRCFANIYVFGQATNSICDQLNPHKNSVFDRRLFFPFPSSEKCQIRLFSLWVGNVPFRLAHNGVASTLVFYSCHPAELWTYKSDVIIEQKQLMMFWYPSACYRHVT